MKFHIVYAFIIVLNAFFILDCTAQTREQDSLILVDIKEMLEMDSFDNPIFIWDLNEPMDNWPLVFLSPTGRVSGLLLSNLLDPPREVFLSPKIVGLDSLDYLVVNYSPAYDIINTSLVNFPDLFRLPLERLQLHPVFPGQLDSLHLLSESLKILRLNNFRFSDVVSIPESVYDLKHLTELFIRERFSGRLDERLGQLTNLEELTMNQTAIDGFIPETISALTNIREITLELNPRMNGVVPDAFEDLKLIDRILGTTIGLYGPIPRSLYQNKYIERVALWNGELTDTLAMDWSPSIKRIDLSTNNIYGSIPQNFFDNRSSVSLSSNELTGELPKAITYDSLVISSSISVALNQLIGGVPREYFNKVDRLSIEYNFFTETIEFDRPIVMESFECESNLFTFEDLIQVVQEFENTGNRITYAPQKTAGEPDTFSVRLGCPVEMELSFDDTVTTSTYYWFKDGQPFDTVIGTNELRIDSMYPALAGSYHAEIVNPLAPDLRLETYPFLLTEESCPVQEVRIDTAICAGEVLQYLGQEYDQEGVFRDTLIRDCCPEFLEINVSQYPAPDFEEEREFEVCQDSVLELRWTAQVPTEGDWIANWQSNEGEIISDSVDWWPEVRGAGVYYVAFQDRYGCLYQDSVTVQQYPSLSLSTEEGDTFCMEERYEINWLISDDADRLRNIMWSGRGIEQGATEVNPIVSEAGLYTLFYEDLRGCGYRDSFTVALHPSNRIDGASSLELCPEDTTSLNWSVMADGIEDYLWSTPDGRLIDNLNAQYPRVSGSGLYLVEYIDQNGCTY
ncbi:MAG TPA: hypothetical protein VJ917_07440, partial [Saprospiraceae bacterium]|nr:hypothetical protein [Saprospiraceae bacterium]